MSKEVQQEHADVAYLEEDIQVVHTLGTPQDPTVVRKTYIVTDKVVRPTLVDEEGNLLSNGCNGIMKNGYLYRPGDEVELDDNTARGFLLLGEVEEK